MNSLLIYGNINCSSSGVRIILPLAAFGLVSADDKSASTILQDAFHFKGFLELASFNFGENALLDDLAGEFNNFLSAYLLVINAVIRPQVDIIQKRKLIKSSAVNRFYLIVACNISNHTTDSYENDD